MNPPLRCIIVITLLSCKQDPKSSFKYYVHENDTLCKRELAAAERDIKQGRLVYCHDGGNVLWISLRAEEEMKQLLKHYNISYRDVASPCVIRDHRTYNCYAKTMHEEIARRFGNNFIDSLLYAADRIWVTKNSDLLFDNESIEGSWDVPAMFLGDKNIHTNHATSLQFSFDKIVDYPTDYRKREGEATVQDYQFTFWNCNTNVENYNSQYYNYFFNIAKNLIEHSLWTPAKV